MPEDSKKNLDKKRNDPKEQRKPRQRNNNASKGDKKPEKIEEAKAVLKVSGPQKTTYQDPGPEFYKNLKRETEEILKITKEEQSKYKKKDIQSNWSKYEMPIESYEEVEEHDVGADYEKLIQAPLSIGGHFQFKHEKSWDMNTGPSLYDKYFEIDLDNLSLAVSTIPFYERNNVDTSLFNETDKLSMNNRATKYKQKYFQDKSFSTPETEAQERIINKIMNDKNDEIKRDIIEKKSNEIIKENRCEIDNIELNVNKLRMEDVPSLVQSLERSESENKLLETTKSLNNAHSVVNLNMNNTDIDKIDDLLEDRAEIRRIINPDEMVVLSETTVAELIQNQVKATNNINATDSPTEMNKNPVIESPEDLEKWLDDFLDG